MHTVRKNGKNYIQTFSCNLSEIWYHNKYYIVFISTSFQGGVHMPRAFLKARDPFSCYSHFVGAVLSVSGLLILLLRLLFDPDISGQLAGAAVVFCLSLIALYSASSVYHFSLRGEAVLACTAQFSLSRCHLADRTDRYRGQAALDRRAPPDRYSTLSGTRLGHRFRFRCRTFHALPRHCAACSRRSCLHGRRHHLHLEAAEFQHPSRQFASCY